MHVDEMYQEVDRRHLMQFVDLVCESEYDPFAMFEAYSRLWERRRADEGEVYFIFKQAVQMYNEVHRQETIPKSAHKADAVVFHWMVDIYLYALYQAGIFFEQSVRMVPPRWLYAHYSPLHETSVRNGWDKAVAVCAHSDPRSVSDGVQGTLASGGAVAGATN